MMEPIIAAIIDANKSTDNACSPFDYLLGGKWKIIRKIGAGSFGDIYLGHNVTTGEEVAIKLEPTSARHPQLFYESRVYRILQAHTKKQKYERIYERKLSTSSEQLCKGYAKEFEQYLRYARNLKFDMSPDYPFLRGLFRRLFQNSQFALDYVFDWALLRTNTPNSNQTAVTAVKQQQQPQQQQQSGGVNNNSGSNNVASGNNASNGKHAREGERNANEVDLMRLFIQNDPRGASGTSNPVMRQQQQQQQIHQQQQQQHTHTSGNGIITDLHRQFMAMPFDHANAAGTAHPSQYQ